MANVSGQNWLDVNLGDGVRTGMRKLGHRAFDVLLLPLYVTANNTIENVFNAAVALLLALVGGALAYLSHGMMPPALIAQLGPLAASKEAAALAMGVLVFIPGFLFVAGFFGGRSLRAIGRLSIYAARRAPGRHYQQRREEMIAAIGNWLKSNAELAASELKRQYGRDLDALLPSALTARLDRFKRTKGSFDYVVFRGLMERKYKSVYVGEGFHARRLRADDETDPRSYYVRARDLRDALKINLIFRYLGADLRDETPDGDRWRREYVTAPERQHLTLWDDSDLPTRFRTFAPHLRWPDDAGLALDSRPNSAGETATYVAIAGIENPLQIPLYLLTLDDIERAMPHAARLIDGQVAAGHRTAAETVERAIGALCEKPVPLFAKKDKHTLQALGGVDATERTIMRRGKGDVLEIRWDPNRIVWDSLESPESLPLRQALALVLNAIDLCIDGDPTTGLAPSVRPVILKRGDLLLTDNQRTLICRRESDFYNVRRTMKLGAGMPPQWWLRGFYGFRMPPSLSAQDRRDDSSRRKLESGDVEAA